jgi:hypothetical protein
VNCEWLRAAGAGRQCAPAALEALVGGPSTPLLEGTDGLEAT